MKIRTYALMTALTTFVLMFAFEAAKELILRSYSGDLSRWESHWITIGFTTMVSAVVSALLIRRYASLKEAEEQLTLKREKLHTLQQVMHKMRHHIGNLSGRLQLLEQEYQASGNLSQDTIARMKKSLDETSHEMNALFALDDPFDQDKFKMAFPPDLPNQVSPPLQKQA